MEKRWDKEPWWLIVLALPILQVKNLILYLSGLETRAAKVAQAICFFPVIVVSTVLWLTVWGFASAILWRLLREAWLYIL
jgi:hypothetical protein